MAKATEGKAEAYLTARPKHLVVFKEPAAKNATLVAKALDASEAKGVSARAGCTVLAARNGVHARVYARLGVAVATLDKDERAELEKSDAVEAVVPNEVRKIPPVVTARESGLVGPGFTDPTVSYLRGMRDAIDAVLRHVGQPGAPVPVVPATPGVFAARATPGFSWCLEMIGMTPTYDVATGDGVTLAVLDTGLDLTHPDFLDRVAEGDTAQSFIPGEGVQDGNGHGTHCAGVAAGPRSPAGGRRYAVAPDVTLLVGKVLSDAGSGFDDQILDGIDWAAEHGAKVISMSLGSERSLGQPFPPQYERVAESLMRTGVLLVAAAGNSSGRPFFTSPVENPASCPSIMGVAAVDQNRNVAPFSCAQMDNIGILDISGPGVAVYSTWTGGGYRSISGTSMATPHVAGVAALYRQRNPNLSAQALWNTLVAQSAALGDALDFGRGLVQVPRA